MKPFLALLLFAASSAVAQTPTSAAATVGVPASDPFCVKDPRNDVRAFCPWLSDLRRGVAAGKSQRDLRNDLASLNPAGSAAINTTVAVLAVDLANRAAVSSMLQAANQMRPDQQLGATSSASGTTSLVTKAGSATLLALALDTGALTQSINGTTATLTSNADELFRLVTGYQPDCIINCGKQGGKVGFVEDHILDPLNFSATFALAQNSSTTSPTSGTASGTTPTSVSSVAVPTGAGKLTAFTAKYQILNKFDPRSTTFQDRWTTQIAGLGALAIKAQNDTTAVYVILANNGAFKDMATNDQYDTELYTAAKSDPTGKALANAFDNLWKSSTNTAFNDTALPAAVATLLQDEEAFRSAWMTAVANTAGVMLSGQYTFNKPLNQPQTHDFTIVYGYAFRTYGSLTFNGSLSIYNGTIPAGANYGRIHFGQASGEYDRNLTSPSKPYQTQLSLAGYWQYQPQPSILNIPAGTVVPGTSIPLPNGVQEFLGTAGNLWVTQGKITIKGPGGINIPLGVSWSNKTDLLQGSKVGGQVGISYDFSTLAGLF